jgi:hypothetical protein
VNLAARGARNMDNGIEMIDEEDVKAQLRRQARAVYLKAIVAACVLTALVLVIPIR